MRRTRHKRHHRSSRRHHRLPPRDSKGRFISRRRKHTRTRRRR